MFLGQKYPKSEAAQKGLSLGEMFKEVGILGGLVVCLLIALFFGDVLKPLLTPDDATAEQITAAAANASWIGYIIGGLIFVGSAYILLS